MQKKLLATRPTHRSRSYLVASLALALCIALGGCGRTSANTSADTSSQDAQTTEASSQPQDTSSSADATDSTSAEKETSSDSYHDQVSVSNLKFSSTKIFGTELDNATTTEPGTENSQPAYMLNMTIANNSDDSVDVSPVIGVTLVAKDDYGEDQSKDVVLGRDSMDSLSGMMPNVSSPYSAGGGDARCMPPMGLAPHETKEVRVYLSGDYITVYDYSVDQGGLKVDGDWIDENGSSTVPGTNVQYSDITSISNAQLLGYAVEKSPHVYVPTSDWDSTVTLQQGTWDYGNYPVNLLSMTGAVTNNTQDRWESGAVKFDFTVDGQPIDSVTSLKIDHVKVGGTVDASDSSIANGGSVTWKDGTYDVELKPALLYYTPGE